MQLKAALLYNMKKNAHAVVNGDCAVLSLMSELIVSIVRFSSAVGVELEHRFDTPRRQKCGI